jgi:hypothetical protein
MKALTSERALALIASGTMIVGLSIQPSSAANDPDYTLQVVAGSGQLSAPAPGPATSVPIVAGGVATDATGDLYIDDVNGYIEKVTPAGALSVVSGTGKVPSTLSLRGIAVGPDGYLYGYEPFTNSIEKMAPDGTWTQVGYSVYPHIESSTIAVDKAGNIYYADATGYLEKMTAAGQASVIGSTTAPEYGKPVPGPVAASPVAAYGVAIDDSGNLYVAGSGYVDKIDTSGNLSIIGGNGTWTAPTPGPATASSVTATSVAADPFGNVYVADGLGYVDKIAPSGDLSIVAGAGASQCRPPVQGPTTANQTCAGPIATDSAGDVFIADGHHFVEKLTPAGDFTVVAGDGRSGAPVAGPATNSPMAPTGAAVDANGDRFIADKSGYIEEVSPSGNLTVIAGNGLRGAPIPGPALASPMSPDAVAVDSAGNVYVADTRGYVDKITPDGTLSVVAGNGQTTGAPTAGDATATPVNAKSIAVDGSGNVYAAVGSSVVKINPAGILSIIVTVPANAASNTVAVDPSGNLFYSEYSEYISANFVKELTTTGSTLTIAGTGQGGNPVAGAATASPISETFGLAADRFGDVYVATGVFVARVSPSGKLSIIGGANFWAGPMRSGPATASALEHSSLAVDGAGNVYVTSVVSDDYYRQGATQLGEISPTPLTASAPAWTVNAMATAQSSTSSTGGIGDVTWALQNPPTGLSMTPDGVLTANFAPTLACWNQPCTVNYGFTATDSSGQQTNGTGSVTVNPGPIYFRTSHQLPNATAGGTYSQVIKVGRGWGNDVLTVVGGALPAHTSLIGNLGKQYAIITGRPPTRGSYAIKVRATDSHGNSTYSWFYINVS